MEFFSKRFWISCVVFVFTVYAFCGFFLVPYLISSQLPQTLVKYKIFVSVPKVQFNPFTFRLSLYDLALFSSDKKPIFSTKSFRMDIKITDLLSHAITLNKIHLKSPKLYLRIDADKKFNILQIGDFKPTEKSKKTKSDWSVNIRHLFMQNTLVHFEDKSSSHEIFNQDKNSSIDANIKSLDIKNISFSNEGFIGKLSIQNLIAESKRPIHKTNLPLFSFEDFQIHNISYKDTNLTIKSVDVLKPTAYIFAVKHSTQKTKKKQTKSFAFHINDLSLKNGSLTLQNETLQQKTITKFDDTFLRAIPLSLYKKSDLTLKTTINQNGYFKASGDFFLSDFKKLSNFHLTLKGLDLVPLSSYSQKFLGYDIKKGDLSLNVVQKISHSTLSGDAKISLEGIKLGKAKQLSPLTLPLNTLIMLLSDSEDNVDLNIPISGDLNDTRFSYSDVLVRTLSNAVTNIVTAPFALLGNILDVNAKGLESIYFEPSSAKIIPSEINKLKQFKVVLEKKPHIILTINGGYDKNIDFKKEQKSQGEYEKLALSRAKNIKKKLLTLGIDASKVRVKKPISVSAKQSQWVGSQMGVETK